MKKTFSVISSAIVTASALLSSLTAGVFAVSAGPQEDGSFVYPDGTVYTADQILSAPIQPHLSVSQVSYEYSEVPEDNIVAVTISVDGAENNWCSSGIHLYYDERLTPVLDSYGDPECTKGNAISKIGASIASAGTDFLLFMTASSADHGLDGDIVTYYFYLPDDYYPGDMYELDLRYISNDSYNDCFTNNAKDETGMLMNAYVFTYGLNDGYIVITEDTTETPTLPPTEPPTEEETTEVPTDPTTDPSAPIIIPSTLTMNVGDTNEVLVANVPDDAIVAWTSDNTSVATVSNGIVTAINAGKATIYAVCNGTIMTCSVTVTKNQYMAGDVNCSGHIEIADAIMIMSYVTNSIEYPLDDTQLLNCDVYQYGDGVGINDAVSIQKYLTKLITELPESYL